MVTKKKRMEFETYTFLLYDKSVPSYYSYRSISGFSNLELEFAIIQDVSDNNEKKCVTV